MSTAARSGPPPLKLEILETKPLSTAATVATLQDFLSNGTAIHSAPTSIAHQVTQVYEKLRLESKRHQ
ncbi:hypothetical protein BGZ70_008470 [Mortierella alpina]|uniref:Uncharacterized protein n=1 Tax=Mortierella alpina TaxID=64518 RepID=A0A9P6M6N0_MORAP|nr:hypothetical protein EC968_002074 [Mortierella alpina]KAF9959493.1 hypothetical protein BGZ72_009545 [Mortierella alpina]KAF9967722.1 hypothetical protein BGZ70_008470 [Mortierella alpina]